MSHTRNPIVKRPVNVTLSVDLVKRARALTGNLSETLETLLADFVHEAEERERRIDRHIAFHNDFVDRHGTLADEFNDL